MTLSEVYLGQLTWESFLASQALFHGFEKAVEEQTGGYETSISPGHAIGLGLDESDYRLAINSGLGALGNTPDNYAKATPYRIELAFDRLAGGLDRLNADFNLLLGDIIWKLELHQETLNNILHEIRLAEFEREARAYRSRAEKAYLNGWYEEALRDFLEAEKRNYPDFAVLRSIANISLYHLVNLGRALEYYSKAARYSRPNDARQSAEAHYFAGVVCALDQRFEEGISHLRQALELNPGLYEAHYQAACLASLAGQREAAVAHLESAIKGDPRYYERARDDKAFEGIRAAVQSLLERMLKPVEEKIAEVKKDAELLKRYVIVKPEKRDAVSSMFQTVEERVSESHTYPDGVEFMKTLSQIQREVRGIYDIFYKQYEMDTRDYARSVAISPDGRTLATGFLYEGIRVWEVETGMPIQWLKGHTASVNSLAFSPDSEWLASGSRDRTIKLWDVYEGKEVRTLEGHHGEVRAVTFSPDGQWLASASHDRTLKLWRVITGREVEPLIGHTRAVTSAVFNPDGSLLASGSIDRTIKLWDVEAGSEIKSLTGHAEGVASLAFSGDGRMIASGGEDKLVKVWDVETGREIQTLRGHINDVTSVAFSPDGELVAAGTLGQTIRIWKIATGQVIKTLWFKEISWHPVTFSPRGQWLAFASRDVQLWLKAILTEEEYADVKAGEERAIRLKQEEEWLAREVAEMKRREREEAEEEILQAVRRAAGECEICGIKLDLARRIARRRRCKAHSQQRRLIRGRGPGARGQGRIGNM
jgi:tetratricopeptide (TPR) repeat protein